MLDNLWDVQAWLSELLLFFLALFIVVVLPDLKISSHLEFGPVDQMYD